MGKTPSTKDHMESLIQLLQQKKAKRKKMDFDSEKGITKNGKDQATKGKHKKPTFASVKAGGLAVLALVIIPWSSLGGENTERRRSLPPHRPGQPGDQTQRHFCTLRPRAKTATEINMQLSETGKLTFFF